MLRTALRDNGLRNVLRRVPNDSVLYMPGLDYGNWHTGTIKDYSGLGNDGAISGATTTVLPSGLAYLDYDASNDETLVTKDTSIDITGEITIEGWYYLTGWGEDNYGRLFNKGSIYHAHWLKGDAIEGVRFRIVGGAALKTIDTANGTIVLNKWQYIACEFNQVNILVDIDGTITTGTAYAGTIDDSSASDLYIGSDSAGASVFGGGIALFRIYNTALGTDLRAQHRVQERPFFRV